MALVYSRPDRTVSSATWTVFPSGTAHAAIDEAVADDTGTYIIHTIGGSVTNCRVGLASIADPAISTGHTVYFRHYLNVVPPFVVPNDLTVYLYQGVTLIASTTVSPTNAWTTTGFVLSALQTDAITDYTALELEFEFTYGGIGGDLWITQAYLEVDTGAPPAAIEVAGAFLGTELVELRDRRLVHLDTDQLEITPFGGEFGVSEADWTPFYRKVWNEERR